jgi:hypothetical protein
MGASSLNTGIAEKVSCEQFQMQIKGHSLRLVISLSALLFASVANAATIKLFYYENGQRGWKGGFKTMEQCEQAAKSNRLSPTQYYCSTTQNYDLERRLGWRP